MKRPYDKGVFINSDIAGSSIKMRFLGYLLPPIILIAGILAIFITILARNIISAEENRRVESFLEHSSEDLRSHLQENDLAKAARSLQRMIDNQNVVSVSLIDEQGQAVIKFFSEKASESVDLNRYSHQLIVKTRDHKAQTWNIDIKLAAGATQKLTDIFLTSQIASFLFIVLSFTIGLFITADSVIIDPLMRLKNGIERYSEDKVSEKIDYEAKDEIGETIYEFNEMIQTRQLRQQHMLFCLEATSTTVFTYDFLNDRFEWVSKFLPETEIETSEIQASHNLFDLLQFKQRSSCKQFWYDLKEAFTGSVSGSMSHHLCLDLPDSDSANKTVCFTITCCWNKHLSNQHCDGIIRNSARETENDKQDSAISGNFHQLYENMPIGIWKSRNDQFFFVNLAMSQMLGFSSPEEAIAGISNISHEIYLRPEDHTFFYDELKKKGEAKGIEIKLKRADGSIFWGALFGRMVRDAKSGNYAEGCLIDISNRRETENFVRVENDMLNTALNASKVCAYQIDFENGKVWLSNSFAQLFNTGQEKIETIKDLQKFIHPQDLELFPPAFDFQRQKLPKETFLAQAQNFRVCIKNQEGEIETRWLRVFFDFFDFSHHNRPRFQTGVILDFTESHLIEDDILSKSQQAETANILKSEFFAGISHELRTPLNAIIGFSELLVPAIENEPEKNYLDSILSAGRSLLTIINDILDLSRLESGKLELVYEPVSIEVLARETSALYSDEARKKGLSFIVEVDDSIPSVILIDNIRIRQIINNLVSNAIKFTEQGKISLFFSAAPSSRPDKTDLLISVEDTGVGVSFDEKDNIFMPFRQKKGQGSKMGGAGMGLAICKKLAEMMNGQIFLKSEPDKGSKFEIRLRNLDVERLASDLQPDSGSRARLFKFEEQKILVVDDTSSNRELLTEALSAVGLTVKSAKNGEEAVELDREFHPHLIVMDIRMPVKDGYEASKEIKTLRDVPIIALTASVNPMESEKFSVFDGYLRKPVRLYDLFSECGRFLKFSIGQEEKTAAPTDAGERAAVGSFEQIINPKSLAGKITRELLAELQQFEGAISIDEVKSFATKIRTLAVEHSFNHLALEAEELFKNATNYDIEATKYSLLKLKASIEQFLNFFGQSYDGSFEPEEP